MKYLPHICMVKSAGDSKVDCYFATGHIRRFDMGPLLGDHCGPVFRPLQDRATFLRTLTVLNGTLAFDLTGNRDTGACIDIDPVTIFEEGERIDGLQEANAEPALNRPRGAGG